MSNRENNLVTMCFFMASQSKGTEFVFGSELSVYVVSWKWQ